MKKKADHRSHREGRKEVNYKEDEQAYDWEAADYNDEGDEDDNGFADDDGREFGGEGDGSDQDSSI